MSVVWIDFGRFQTLAVRARTGKLTLVHWEAKVFLNNVAIKAHRALGYNASCIVYARPTYTLVCQNRRQTFLCHLPTDVRAVRGKMAAGQITVPKVVFQTQMVVKNLLRWGLNGIGARSIFAVAWSHSDSPRFHRSALSPAQSAYFCDRTHLTRV